MADLDNIIKDLLGSLSKRQQEVLTKRFGLKGRRLTLAAIGGQFGITRERVRQIESAGLKALKPRVASAAKDFVSRVKSYLDDSGGVRRDDFMVNDLPSLFRQSGTRVKDLGPKINFLLCSYGEPHFHDGDEEWHDFWYVDEGAKKKAFEYVKELEFRLKEKKGVGDQPKDPVLINYASISRKFHTNVFGDFGLAGWREVRPRTVGDKSYLVLKKKGSPLHFTLLAEEINKLKFDHKEANAQTVHNELIKDNRFVLVGRGIYGLQEQGFEPGTARDVIARILKTNGSIHSHQVVELVKKERFLKENTILLNLQDKRYFRRLPDGRYTLRQA